MVGPSCALLASSHAISLVQLLADTASKKLSKFNGVAAGEAIPPFLRRECYANQRWYVYVKMPTT